MLRMSGIPEAVRLLTQLIMPLALAGLVSALKEGLHLYSLDNQLKHPKESVETSEKLNQIQ